MPNATFGHHPWTVQKLVDDVESGRIRLPDIQRPFVWKNAKVRDLIDSMYRGYPVGELMFWASTNEDNTRTIGDAAKSQAGSMQVIDGQQRVTSLYAVFKSVKVHRDDYSRERITIAFNPLTERFAVPDSAIRRSIEWVQDIREVFDSAISVRRRYLAALKASGAHAIDDQSEDRVEQALSKLEGVKGYVFNVVQIDEGVGRDVVADVFVRINSEGMKLNASDFILTWLSVFWEEGRAQLEDFAKASRFSPAELSKVDDRTVTWTPHNPYLVLDPGQVLRVSVAVGNRRAKLADAYNALRGRDPRTREIVAKLREAELTKLRSGQERVLKPNNWDEFLRVIERAGIRSSSMVTAKNAVIYGYALWLIGRTEFNVPISELREVMARWYFMAQITGRYSSSPETRGQEDLNMLAGLQTSSSAFVAAINTQVDTTLTDDWWRVTLPEDLHTSNAVGPAYTGYVAALTILDADVLLATSKVKDWLSPARTAVKGIEKHHLFPRDHLKTALGVSSTRQINQVANQALVEWSDNIAISSEEPSTYWPAQIEAKSIGAERLGRQMYWHGLPAGWTKMTYDDFLSARRALLAAVTHEGFKMLRNPDYAPADAPQVDEPAPTGLPTFEELVLSGRLPAGTLLSPVDGDRETLAEVTEGGSIIVGERECGTPADAAREDGADAGDGWDYWQAHLGSDPVPIASLRNGPSGAVVS